MSGSMLHAGVQKNIHSSHPRAYGANEEGQQGCRGMFNLLEEQTRGFRKKKVFFVPPLVFLFSFIGARPCCLKSAGGRTGSLSPAPKVGPYAVILASQVGRIHLRI